MRPPKRQRVLVAVFLLGGTLAATAEDRPQWGGSPQRNNVSSEQRLPTDWNPGEFARKSGNWIRDKAVNIKWVATLGTQTYTSPAIAGGRVFMGTNNGGGHLKRCPPDMDLGCLLCFDERTGEFQWQFSAEKLPTGRAHDWPLQGIGSTPLVEGDRAWFVSNRGEVVCVDAQGFYDGEDDGPVVNEYVPVASIPAYVPLLPVKSAAVAPLVASLDRGEVPAELRGQFVKAGEELPADVRLRADEPGWRWSFSIAVDGSQRDYVLRLEGSLQAYRRQTPSDKQEADVVWRFDVMKQLGAQQHNLAACSLTSWKDTLFVCTGNGVNEAHLAIPAPEAPSFFAMDKRTGEVLWTSNLPGYNIHHAQWSGPAVGLLGGIPQVIFNGGDGWVYSFHAEKWRDQKPVLLWKFDTNPKDAVLELGGRGTRNEPIAIPVLYDDKVYITTGQDPEHGEGLGIIWCIDPARRTDGSDVSPQKVVDRKGNALPARRKTNFMPWRETRLWNAQALDRELDAGTIGDYLKKALKGVGFPADELAVSTLTKSCEWEIQVGVGADAEKPKVVKRTLVSDAGQLEVLFFLLYPSGERVIDNPDSAAVWKYDTWDRNGNGKIEFEEAMHRTISSVVIANDLLFCPDFSGLLHCLDAQTGTRHWTCDMLAAAWSTPLIADGRVFVCDEDGDVAIFQLSADPRVAGAAARIDPETGIVTQELQPRHEINMLNGIYSSPTAANGILYIANKDHLFAIAWDDPPQAGSH